MFRLVLVDDKKDIVQGIAGAVDWEAMGVQVHCFYNGKDARAHILENCADMVITDIKMPFLNGLDLAREVLEVFPEVRFLVLTGYDEFAYAREAVRLGIVEYLSKPVRIEEIRELVVREMERKAARQREKEKQTGIWLRYQKSIPLMRMKWFQRCAEGQAGTGEKEVREQWDALGISLSTRGLMVVLAEPDSGDNKDGLLSYAIENMGREIISETYGCEAFGLDGGRVAFLVNFQEDWNKTTVYYRLYALIVELQKKMQEFFGVTVSAGIGDCQEDYRGIGCSYHQARKALEHKFYMGNNAIISVLDIPEIKDGGAAEYPGDMEEEIVRLAGKDGEAVLEKLGLYFQAVRRMKQTEPARLQEHLMSLLLRLCSSCPGGQEIRIGDVMEQFKKNHTMDAMELWMTGFVKELCREGRQEANSEIEKSVRKVKQYIDSHCGENITLRKMADYVYVSPSYLSFSFKEILQVNFNEYITLVRMEKAKELLEVPGSRVYEVCRMVGYSDKKYFADLFKKYTGMLPREWAKKGRGTEHGVD